MGSAQTFPSLAGVLNYNSPLTAWVQLGWIVKINVLY